MKYIYRVIRAEHDHDQLIENTLNECASHGWKVISVEQMSNRKPRIILERPYEQKYVKEEFTHKDFHSKRDGRSNI